MKLYAAFTEYGDIWPTTIRRTEQETLAALKAEPGVDPADPLAGGMNIGEFGNDGVLDAILDRMLGSGWMPPKPDEITWVAGWRAR